MNAPASVLALVERFDRDKPAYKSLLYNETQARQEFIDPLFEALGWHIGNRGGAAAKAGQERAVLQRQIDATDRQIDSLVYELYGLSDDEIAIVEGATK